MSDYNYDEKGDMGDGGNTTVIPTQECNNKIQDWRFVNDVSKYIVRGNNVEKAMRILKKKLT